MKNCFLFYLKSFVCSWDVEKWLDKKANFNIYDVTTWETNSFNTHFAQHQLKDIR